MSPDTWLLGLCLLPLPAGLLLMLLPPALWRRMAPRLEQAGTAMAVLAAGLLALGIALAALFSQALWLGWHSSRWQAVPGVITESRLAAGMSPRSTLTYWEPRLRYSYVFAGTVLEGHRPSFHWEKSSDRAALQARLDRDWFPGAAVTVWVDPARPARAVLRTGASGWLAVFVATGVVLAGVGVWLLRLALPDLRQAGKPAPTKRQGRARRPRGPAPVVASRRGQKPRG